MTTITIDKKLHRILKKVSAILGIPMSSLVKYSVIRTLREIAEKEVIPDEITIEMEYYRLLELYNVVKMLENIKYWFERRLDDLLDKASEEQYTPLRKMIRKYAKELEDVYRRLEEKMNEKIDLEKIEEIKEIVLSEEKHEREITN